MPGVLNTFTYVNGAAVIFFGLNAVRVLLLMRVPTLVAWWVKYAGEWDGDVLPVQVSRGPWLVLPHVAILEVRDDGCVLWERRFLRPRTLDLPPVNERDWTLRSRIPMGPLSVVDASGVRSRVGRDDRLWELYRESWS